MLQKEFAMTLLELEKKYWESLDNQSKQLVSLYQNIKSSTYISLEEREVTKAILLRMKAYYHTQNNIKEFLNKRYLTSASDFFVEAIVFYLKLVLDKQGSSLEVHSERQLAQKRRAIRPDISVWNKENVLAIIECKTQLGWNRDEWETDFIKRESKLRDSFPNAKSFLVVMTSKNWPGFPRNDKKVGEQYFTLSSIWPPDISKDKIDSVIINPIESLYKKILSIQ
jgi:hypothetical protein